MIWNTFTINGIMLLISKARQDAQQQGKFLLLDTYCCGGGASKGYVNAGFVVVGVDIEDRSESYHKVSPYFVQADAIEFLKRFGTLFDAVVGSPPCQYANTLTNGTNKANEWGKGTDADNGGWVDMIPATRQEFDYLNSRGIPTVIENVAGAKIRKDLKLCGTMFGLKVFRHRWFEVNGFALIQPEHEQGPVVNGRRQQHVGTLKGWNHGRSNPDGEYYQVYGNGGQKGSIAEWQHAMGIDWLTERNELAESIPPAYTEWIGHFLKAELTVRQEDNRRELEAELGYKLGKRFWISPRIPVAV